MRAADQTIAPFGGNVVCRFVRSVIQFIQLVQHAIHKLVSDVRGGARLMKSLILSDWIDDRVASSFPREMVNANGVPEEIRNVVLESIQSPQPVFANGNQDVN